MHVSTQSFSRILSIFSFPILEKINFFHILCKKFEKNFQNKSFSPLFYNLYRLFYKRSLKNIPISFECFNFFEKLMYFAKIKYKAPIITNDLLTLAFLESKDFFNINFLLDDLDKIYEIKYFLIKNLYEQEFSIKEEIIKTMQYFSYLLKIEYSEKEFKTLIRKENVLLQGNLKLKTSLLRNFTLQKNFKNGIFTLLEKEIFQSIFISSPTRTYKYV